MASIRHHPNSRQAGYAVPLAGSAAHGALPPRREHGEALAEVSSSGGTASTRGISVSLSRLRPRGRHDEQHEVRFGDKDGESIHVGYCR